jgi:hypothetical protein
MKYGTKHKNTGTSGVSWVMGPLNQILVNSPKKGRGQKMVNLWGCDLVADFLVSFLESDKNVPFIPG